MKKAIGMKLMVPYGFDVDLDLNIAFDDFNKVRIIFMILKYSIL